MNKEENKKGKADRKECITRRSPEVIHTAHGRGHSATSDFSNCKARAHCTRTSRVMTGVCTEIPVREKCATLVLQREPRSVRVHQPSGK